MSLILDAYKRMYIKREVKSSKDIKKLMLD